MVAKKVEDDGPYEYKGREYANLGRVIQQRIAEGDTLKNWRAWGSWFSWGSPVGLGIFFVLCAFTTWILFHL